MRVVCSSLPGPGHAYPMLAVARALASRGHDVVMLSGPQHAEDSARAGCRFVTLPRTAGTSSPEAIRLYDDAAEMAEALLPQLVKLEPDVVVHDLITLAPALCAEALGVPHATLVIHGLHTPSRDWPPFGWGYGRGRGPLGRRRDEWMRRGKRRDMERARDDLNVARAGLGLPPTQRLDAQLSGELVLVATLPSLELPRNDWPRAAHVVGPCLWDADAPAVAAPQGDAPLVLVAASTAHDQGRLVRAAIAAVARLGARAVVTTGRGVVPSHTPPGVVAAGFAAHDLFLPGASAVVCNGGHGITVRALSAGVPVVIVPGHGDQRENGWRVSRIGAGELVQRPDARKIARGLRRVLTRSSYREAAERLRDEAARIDGPARAARLIETLPLRAVRSASRI